jgi:hypothetical protein
MHRSLLRLTRAIVFAINSKCFFVIFILDFCQEIFTTLPLGTILRVLAYLVACSSSTRPD